MIRSVLFAMALLVAAVPVRAETDDKIISLSSEGVAMSIRVEAPRLEKSHEETKGAVVVETWLAQPSQVRLVMETLPGKGLFKKPALLKATMERPLIDKPSPYDGGLVKTLKAFVTSAAADWDGKDQQAFAAECAMVLASSGCDRTLKGVRVTMSKIGADRFQASAWRP